MLPLKAALLVKGTAVFAAIAAFAATLAIDVATWGFGDAGRVAFGTVIGPSELGTDAFIANDVANADGATEACDRGVVT